MWYVGIGLIILFSGCTFKDQQMFSNYDPSYISQGQDINMSFANKIKPDDILKIDIYNMNQKESTLFNSVNGAGENEYVVSSNGTIYLPLLEEVYVQGLTVETLRKKLMKKYRMFFRKPYIKIAIKNHEVYVFGEVKNPGLIPMRGDRISLVKVLAESGGLGDYAMSNQVHVIAEEEGKYKIRTLDMSRLDTLTLNNTMLKNNSIVYVEPRTVKYVNRTIKDYLPLLQVIGGLISTYLAVDYLTDGRD